MAGELNFNEAFVGKDNNALALCGQFIFLLFVFLIIIVLLNLLTGIAVADVKYLMQGAQVTKVRKQIEQINFLENIFHFLRKRTPNFFSRDIPECYRRRIEHDFLKNSNDIPVESKHFSKELQARIKQRICGQNEPPRRQIY